MARIVGSPMISEGAPERGLWGDRSKAGCAKDGPRGRPETARCVLCSRSGILIGGRETILEAQRSGAHRGWNVGLKSRLWMTRARCDPLAAACLLVRLESPCCFLPPRCVISCLFLYRIRSPSCGCIVELIQTLSDRTIVRPSIPKAC